MIIILIFNNGDKQSINIKNKNIKINDFIDKIYNNFLKNQYKDRNNIIIKLTHKGINLVNKLSDYNINNNSELLVIIKSKNKNIQERNSIIDDYIISPFSSSFSNSFENDYNKFNSDYILDKIKNIENELSEIKDYLNSYN